MSKRKSATVATGKDKPGCASVNGYDTWSQGLMVIITTCGWPRRATAGKLAAWHKYRDRGMTPQAAYATECKKIKVS